MIREYIEHTNGEDTPDDCDSYDFVDVIYNDGQEQQNITEDDVEWENVSDWRHHTVKLPDGFIAWDGREWDQAKYTKLTVVHRDYSTSSGDASDYNFNWAGEWQDESNVVGYKLDASEHLWIEHDGKCLPIPPDSRVDTEDIDGDRMFDISVDAIQLAYWEWQKRESSHYNIVRYRIITIGEKLIPIPPHTTPPYHGSIHVRVQLQSRAMCSAEGNAIHYWAWNCDADSIACITHWEMVDKENYFKAGGGEKAIPATVANYKNYTCIVHDLDYAGQTLEGKFLADPDLFKMENGDVYAASFLAKKGAEFYNQGD